MDRWMSGSEGGSVVSDTNGAKRAGGGASDTVQEARLVGSRIFFARGGWCRDNLGSGSMIFWRKGIGGDGSWANGRSIERNPTPADGIITHRRLRSGFAAGAQEAARG